MASTKKKTVNSPFADVGHSVGIDLCQYDHLWLFDGVLITGERAPNEKPAG